MVGLDGQRLVADGRPALGLGLMRLRDEPGQEPDRDPVAVVHAALDAGITMLDTADMYGNEELVGRTIRGRRDEVLLCSKFGVVWGDGGDWSVRADADYVRDACEASLQRLGVDAIDLYYLHHRSDSTPIEETVTAMAGLVGAGKVRAVGLSNVTEEDLRRAHAVHPVTAVQEEWSLVGRDVERVLPAVAELGVTVVAHSPTGHGALHAPQEGSALAEIAAARGLTTGQVAIAWVRHAARRGGVDVLPLPGTTRVSHLPDLLGAVAAELSDSDVERLEAS